METAVLFKIIQRRNKFRNPNHLIELPLNFIYTAEEYKSAKEYIQNLERYDINYSYPQRSNYPVEFLKMKEPPLFFEYRGAPLWNRINFLSVVGSRNIHSVTEQWLKQHLTDFIRSENVGVVSGGATGVDQLAHLIAIKNKVPTVFILPSGLLHLYPKSLLQIKNMGPNENVCFISEFEINQQLHKSHFYFRNRLIAALGKLTFVAQASLKSGSLLTVHHCLEMGKPVLTIPAHPEMNDFDGNLKLLFDGAYSIRNFEDLLDYWRAESWSN